MLKEGILPDTVALSLREDMLSAHFVVNKATVAEAVSKQYVDPYLCVLSRMIVLSVREELDVKRKC